MSAKQNISPFCDKRGDVVMKWEYKVVGIDSLHGLGNPANLQEELNHYGNEGWELIGVMKKPHEGVGWNPKPDDGSVVFKRVVSNQ